MVRKTSRSVNMRRHISLVSSIAWLYYINSIGVDASYRTSSEPPKRSLPRSDKSKRSSSSSSSSSRSSKSSGAGRVVSIRDERHINRNAFVGPDFEEEVRTLRRRKLASEKNGLAVDEFSAVSDEDAEDESGKDPISSPVMADSQNVDDYEQACKHDPIKPVSQQENFFGAEKATYSGCPNMDEMCNESPFITHDQDWSMTMLIDLKSDSRMSHLRSKPSTPILSRTKEDVHMISYGDAEQRRRDKSEGLHPSSLLESGTLHLPGAPSNYDPSPHVSSSNRRVGHHIQGMLKERPVTDDSAASVGTNVAAQSSSGNAVSEEIGARSQTGAATSSHSPTSENTSASSHHGVASSSQTSGAQTPVGQQIPFTEGEKPPGPVTSTPNLTVVLPDASDISEPNKKVTKMQEAQEAAELAWGETVAATAALKKAFAQVQKAKTKMSEAGGKSKKYEDAKLEVEEAEIDVMKTKERFRLAHFAENFMAAVLIKAEHTASERVDGDGNDKPQKGKGGSGKGGKNPETREGTPEKTGEKHTDDIMKKMERIKRALDAAFVAYFKADRQADPKDPAKKPDPQQKAQLDIRAREAVDALEKAKLEAKFLFSEEAVEAHIRKIERQAEDVAVTGSADVQSSSASSAASSQPVVGVGCGPSVSPDNEHSQQDANRTISERPKNMEREAESLDVDFQVPSPEADRNCDGVTAVHNGKGERERPEKRKVEAAHYSEAFETKKRKVIATKPDTLAAKRKHVPTIATTSETQDTQLPSASVGADVEGQEPPSQPFSLKRRLTLNLPTALWRFATGNRNAD